MQTLASLERTLTDLDGEVFPAWAELARCEAVLALLGKGPEGARMLEREEWHPGRRIGRLRSRWWGFEPPEAAGVDLVAGTVVSEMTGKVPTELLTRFQERCATGWGAQAALGLGFEGDVLVARSRFLAAQLWGGPRRHLRWEGWTEAVLDGAATTLVRWLGRRGCTYAYWAPEVCVLAAPEMVSAALASLHPGVSVWDPRVDVAEVLGVTWPAR